MANEYFGVANYLTREHSIPPREIWFSLMPGSDTYDWIRADKSHFGALKVMGSIAAPVRDTMKLALYSGVAYGLAKMIGDVANSPIVKNTIDNLF